MSDGELKGLTTVFMSAGGEEPASHMAAVLYYLLMNPQWMKLVQKELRTIFTSAEDIDYDSILKLPYMNAVMDETHRIRPAGSGHFPRRTVQQEVIDNHIVPAGVGRHSPHTNPS